MFRRVMKFLKIFVLVCLVLAFITGYKYQKSKIENEKESKEIKITENDISKNIEKNIESEKEESKDNEEVKENQEINNFVKTSEKKVSNNNTKSNKVETNNSTNNNEVKVENKNNNNENKTETIEQPVQENTISNTNNTTTTSNTSSALDEAFSKHTCSYSIYKENGVEKEYNSFSECTSDYGKVLDSADSAMCYTSGYDQNGNEKFKMQICYK